MSAYRPTPQQERWLAAAARLGIEKNAPWMIERSGGWRTTALLTRCAFFVLGVIATVLLAGILFLMKIPAPLFVAGVIAVALAMIRWLRKPHRGITSAEIENDKNSLQLLELAGASNFAMPAAVVSGPAYQGEGGKF